MCQISHLLPQNWVVRSPPYFAQGILGMTPQNPENFVKIWQLVTEKLFETEIIFSGPPFTGGPVAKILFLSTQRLPTAQKKFEPPDLSFWRYGVKSSTFPSPPPKLGEQIPSIFSTGYPIDDPQNPEGFVKVSQTVPRYLAFYCPSLWPRYNSIFHLNNRVARYSFTSILCANALRRIF